ncbi:MAG: 6-carboxytetrahydropterin synthase [Bacteroidetes bacterium]|nr:6-carboxytetrahydropterin synthase [Bacteroidota bacterium]
MLITRRERFSSSHRLYREDWSEEKNFEIFDKCSNLHGHNYELFITVQGTVNKETGFVVNLKELSRVVKQNIIEKLDHKNLNTDVDFLKNTIVTSENIAIAIWGNIETKIIELGVELYCIKLVETENNFIEYYGNKHK